MRNSIRNKLIAFLLLAIIVPITTSNVITYLFTTREVKDEAVARNSQLLFQSKINLQNYMNIINNLSLSIYNDSSSGGTMYRIIANGLDDYQSETVVSHFLLTLNSSLPDIYQVYLEIVKSDRSYLMFNRKVVSESGVSLARSPEPPSYYGHIEPTRMSHAYGMHRNKFLYYSPKQVFTLHRPIYNVPSQNIIGYLSIDVLPDTLDMISSELYEAGEELYIIDHNGQVIHSSEHSTIGTSLADEAWFQNILGSSAAAGSFEWKDDTFNGIRMYDKLSAPYIEWYVVKGIPYKLLYQKARSLGAINSAVSAAFLIVVAIITVIISLRFTTPIRQLINEILKIEHGQLHTDLATKRTDEIGVLFRRFRQMMHTINNLVFREYRLELANKDMQLKALQAQVNPHFMNNALQSIGTLALQHEKPNIYSLISSLGQMMSYSMDTGETIVPLSAELRYVKSYIELQQQRFEDELDVVFAVDEQVTVLHVPKMIIQPIVENYFKHGFEGKDASNRLSITCKLSNTRQNLLIDITDNGRGMNEAALAALKERLNKANVMLPHKANEKMDSIGPLHNHSNEPLNQTKNIGLENVLLRLQLYYGAEAQMQIEACKPQGFNIKLFIPLHREDALLEGTDR